LAPLYSARLARSFVSSSLIHLTCRRLLRFSTLRLVDTAPFFPNPPMLDFPCCSRTRVLSALTHLICSEEVGTSVRSPPSNPDTEFRQNAPPRPRSRFPLRIIENRVLNPDPSHPFYASFLPPFSRVSALNSLIGLRVLINAVMRPPFWAISLLISPL